jgi:hypothetical protein
LELAVRFFLPLAKGAQAAGKAVWLVADGAYAKRAFLKPMIAAGIGRVTRLRKDAALYNLPTTVKRFFVVAHESMDHEFVFDTEQHIPRVGKRSTASSMAKSEQTLQDLPGRLSSHC